MEAFFFINLVLFVRALFLFVRFLNSKRRYLLRRRILHISFYSFLYKNKENNQTAKDETNQRKNKGKQKGNYCRQPFV